MVKRNHPETKAAPTSQSVTTDNAEEKSNRPETFVVIRDGFRVSEREYSSSDDVVAIEEQKFWKRVATNHSYGESVNIVKYDSRNHRVW